MEFLDFTRCQRADGSHYGTAGVCRKGRENPLDLTTLLKKANSINVREFVKTIPETKILGEGAYAVAIDVGNGVVAKIGEIAESEKAIMNDLKNIDGVPRVVAENVSSGGNILAMTRVPGITVEEHMKQQLENNPSMKSAEPYFEAINAALPILKEIHKKGIAHNDLNTGNILYDSKSKKASIIDFGEAKKSHSLAQGEVIGLYRDAVIRYQDWQRYKSFDPTKFKNVTTFLKNGKKYEASGAKNTVDLFYTDIM